MVNPRHEDSVYKASILIEALPYIRRFYGKRIVIKYGGHAMLTEEGKTNFAMDIILMQYVGIKPVIVHGGGPEISEMMRKVGKVPEFVDGLRVTDRETLEIVQMVLVGKINTEIVGLINRHGGRAVGLNGNDANLIMAKKAVRELDTPNGPVKRDLGYVGEVVSINRGIIDTLVESGYVPVISPIAQGEDGHTYNVNADPVAAKLASAIGAEKLVLLTDVEGIFEDPDTRTKLLSSLDAQNARTLMAEGRISGGMIPKVEACLAAVEGGVSRAHIIDGRVPHSILLEMFTDEGTGTMIVAK